MVDLPAPPLLNDLYELTMAQSYLSAGLAGRRAVFELFYRRPPHGGGFALAAGIDAALDFVEGLRFGPAEIEYLASLGLFRDDLLRRLESFRFQGDIDALPEGTVVFPGEPILSVSAPILEAQVLETPLLNLVGFPTLVATKAARVVEAASPAEVVEFGCRRAQGPDGALTATRASFVGGCRSTSNLEAGRRFGIPVKGTMAHSFVLAFPSEIEAFRAFTGTYPRNAVLLIDTHHSLRSGLPNAITAGLELRKAGGRLLGVRIDSGDLAAIGFAARQALDAAGLNEVTVVASGDLDEHRIQALRAAGAPIDAYGVGGRLASSAGDTALTCVYKLVAVEEPGTGRLRGRMKETDDPEKATLPGKKQLFRELDGSGAARGDLLALDPGEEPALAESGSERVKARLPLLEPAFRSGVRLLRRRDLSEIQSRARKNLEAIPREHRRLVDPLPYPVRISPALSRLVKENRSSDEPAGRG
jgi:nicotinate phosphoribosyltransferase